MRTRRACTFFVRNSSAEIASPLFICQNLHRPVNDCMGFLDRRKKDRSKDDDGDGDGSGDFESSAIGKVTGRQDEMESILRDFIGETKRRFTEQDKDRDEQKQLVTGLSEKVDRLNSTVSSRLTGGGSAIRSTSPSSAPGGASSIVGSPESSSDPALLARIERLETVLASRAEEEENDPVAMVIREATNEMKRKLAKNIASTMKTTIYQIADDYSRKLKKAVVKQTGPDAPDSPPRS